MASLTPARAAEVARTALDVSRGAPASAWRVRRLDRAAEAYYLVVVGAPDAAEGVVAVDAATGTVRGSARLRGGGSTIGIDADRARTLAGAGSHDAAELVWQPCAASRSPLYPLWEIETGGIRVYVDQQGNVHRRLTPGGPGGRTDPDG
jgi:hypothetical protein